MQISLCLIVAVIAVVLLVMAVRNEGELPVPVVGDAIEAVVGTAK